MDNLSLSAASFYTEPPVSPTPSSNGSAHTEHHVPEFAGIPSRTLSPIVETPRVEVPAEPEPTAAPVALAAIEDNTPSLERMLLKFGLLTPTQLGDAMREESATGRPLWEIIQERGWVSREDLIRLAEHSSDADAASEPAPVAVEPTPVAVVPELVAVEAEPVAVEPEPVAVVVEPEPVAVEPAPAFEPAPTPQVVPLPIPAPVAEAPAPAPLPPPLPIAPAPLPVPAPVVEAVAPPVVALAPAPEPVPVAPAEPDVSAPVADFVQAVGEALEPAAPAPVFEVAPAPVAQAMSEVDAEPESETAFKVVLRLANGERIDAHTCNGAAAARRHAEELVRGLAAGPERWPYFSGRFVRPESIISVDVEAAL